MRSLFLAATLVLAGCAIARPTPPACELSSDDRAWIDGSLEAWRFSAREITGVRVVRPFEAVFFDNDCVLTSANAFSAERLGDVTWTATAHAGTVTLPNDDEMPAGVTSFASADDVHVFFVMSTPSVWRAAGVRNDALGLEAMMTAVLLHEGAHVAQASSYGARMTALTVANNLPETFNDDSIQERFGADADFARSIERETELLFHAAAAPDDATARRLAREARVLMLARQAQWFTGADAYLTEAEDIWLTFEGAGQWVAYQWLVHPAGGGVEAELAMTNFGPRGRWWSQTQGLALALAVDRLARLDWKRHAFGDGAMTLSAMLDASLAN